MFTRLSPYGQAVILALSGYFLFSMADVSAKILSARHPIVLCLFIPSLIALIGMVARILNVNSLRLIPIADFYCIVFLSPFVVMALSVLLYKEAIHWPRILVLILSFSGVVITIGPHFNELNIGYLFACFGMLFGSLNIFLVRKIGSDEYSPLFGLFPILGVLLTSAPFAIPHLTTDLPLTDIGIFIFYGVALIGAHNFLPMAFARTPSVSRLTPLHYSQMVWGILAGIFIFDTPSEINTFLGGGLIVASGLWLFYYETFSSKKTVS